MRQPLGRRPWFVAGVEQQPASIGVSDPVRGGSERGGQITQCRHPTAEHSIDRLARRGRRQIDGGEGRRGETNLLADVLPLNRDRPSAERVAGSPPANVRSCQLDRRVRQLRPEGQPRGGRLTDDRFGEASHGGGDPNIDDVRVAGIDEGSWQHLGEPTGGDGTGERRAKVRQFTAEQHAMVKCEQIIPTVHPVTLDLERSRSPVRNLHLWTANAVWTSRTGTFGTPKADNAVEDERFVIWRTERSGRHPSDSELHTAGATPQWTP